MEKLIVSSSPHFNGGKTTQNIMLDVIIALTPAMIASVILFGFRAAVVILTCVAACVASEYLSRRVMKRTQTVGDLSCVVTGILLALNLPSTINPLIAIFGSVAAIVVVKQMFGGIGQNFVNPALTGRIILLNSFPSRMTHWVQPFDYAAGADAVTTATPLGILKEGGGELPSYLDLFLGNTGGCLGETCALALLLGGIYLIVRRVISPVILPGHRSCALLLHGPGSPVRSALRRPAAGCHLHGHRLHHQPSVLLGTCGLCLWLRTDHHAHPSVRLPAGRRVLLHHSDEYSHSAL